MKTIFENWYKKLTEAQQKEILDYVFNEKIKSLKEVSRFPCN
jgi:hypothetical protein